MTHCGKDCREAVGERQGRRRVDGAGSAVALRGRRGAAGAQRTGGTALSAAYAGPSQVERISAGSTTFTNGLVGVSATTEAGATTATSRDPNGP